MEIEFVVQIWLFQPEAGEVVCLLFFKVKPSTLFTSQPRVNQLLLNISNICPSSRPASTTVFILIIQLIHSPLLWSNKSWFVLQIFRDRTSCSLWSLHFSLETKKTLVSPVTYWTLFGSKNNLYHCLTIRVIFYYLWFNQSSIWQLRGCLTFPPLQIFFYIIIWRKW